ncbi:MAG TPA: acyl-CoA dehydrogenase family protein, partial [Vicinamibacteria bacterium]|nr:acyl-CoA dehydrogenase family protein [Vicinamibacteria bacterium]
MNEARRLLADVVGRLFTEQVTPEVIEAAERGEWPEGLWQAVEENGLTLTLVPEAAGGGGGTWGDAHVVVSAVGRHAVPLPLVETIVASWLLAEAGLAVPAGPLTVAPVQRHAELRLARDGGGWRVSGFAARVPWGRRAGHVVVVTPVDGRTMVALVPGGAARAEGDANLALEPRDTLTFDAVPALAAAPAERLPADAIWLYGALARAAQMAGGLEFLLAQSVKYAGERRQFGRAIGSFQAIQHNLALLAGHSAAAGMAAAHAFRAAEDRVPRFETAAAKVRVGEAAGLGAGIAHQVHGAIGFTYEHSLHFVTRRLWSWRAEFGGESQWASALGREVAARG